MIDYNMPAHVYHARPEVSSSMLSALNRSPAHCHALHLNPLRPTIEPTPAMRFGTLVHSLILEPASFNERYVTKPSGMNFATKEGKAWRDAVPDGVEIITDDDASAAWQMSQAVEDVPELSRLLAKGHAEASVFWTDADTGLECRARPDWLHFHDQERVTVLDLKTIADLSDTAVSRAIASYGYHRQQAHYTNGLRANGLRVDAFVFAFVSSNYPYLAAAYVIDDESTLQGADEVAELLTKFAECKRANRWQYGTDGYQLAALPAWAKRSTEIEVAYA